MSKHESRRAPHTPTRLFELRHSFVIRHSVFGIGLLAWILHTSAFIPCASAQPAQLEWHKESGGGAVAAAGGPYQLHSTLFQSDAGRSDGGVYRLEGGFQAVALQQQGFPPLSLAITGTSPVADRFELVWTGEETLILQHGYSAAGGFTWEDTTNTVTRVNGTNRVSFVIPTSVPSRIYKLRRP